MNARIKELAEQAGLQSNKDEAMCFVELIVRELQLNGYDDAARCLVEEYKLTEK